MAAQGTRSGTARTGAGLLPDPECLPPGYREYHDEDVDRVRFIRTAQRLGLSLVAISEILGFRERGERPCDYVLGVLDRQVADLDERMAEMARLRRELLRLQKAADALPSDGACFCAVIEHSPSAASAGDGGPGPRNRR